MMFSIPQTFNEWKICIVNDCKIPLTKEFAQKRLEVYKNQSNEETQRFVALYGEQHLHNVIKWFSMV